MGSNLLKKLLVNNFEVILLKRSFSNLDRIYSVLEHPNLTLFDLDIDKIERVFSNGAIESIIHTATEYGRSGLPIHLVLETNLVYPIKLIELGVKYGVKTFINTDSYFNKCSLNYSHLSNYIVSKRNLVSWLKVLSDHIYIANVALEHIYGPFDSQTKFVGSLIQSVAIKKAERVALTLGHQRRDFIYVDDATEAYIYLLNYMSTTKEKFSEFQLGTGNSVSVRTFAEIIKSLSHSRTILGFGDVEYRSDEIMDSKAENSTLLDLGWRPQVSLQDGVMETIKAFRV